MLNNLSNETLIAIVEDLNGKLSAALCDRDGALEDVRFYRDRCTEYRYELDDQRVRIDQLEAQIRRLSQIAVPDCLLDLPVELRGNLDAFVSDGKKIGAIKALREATGIGLREAKEAIERWYGI